MTQWTFVYVTLMPNIFPPVWLTFVCLFLSLTFQPRNLTFWNIMVPHVTFWKWVFNILKNSGRFIALFRFPITAPLGPLRCYNFFKKNCKKLSLSLQSVFYRYKKSFWGFIVIIPYIWALFDSRSNKKKNNSFLEHLWEKLTWISFFAI